MHSSRPGLQHGRCRQRREYAEAAVALVAPPGAALLVRCVQLLCEGDRGLHARGLQAPHALLCLPAASIEHLLEQLEGVAWRGSWAGSDGGEYRARVADLHRQRHSELTTDQC